MIVDFYFSDNMKGNTYSTGDKMRNHGIPLNIKKTLHLNSVSILLYILILHAPKC